MVKVSKKVQVSKIPLRVSPRKRKRDGPDLEDSSDTHVEAVTSKVTVTKSRASKAVKLETAIPTSLQPKPEQTVSPSPRSKKTIKKEEIERKVDRDADEKPDIKIESIKTTSITEHPDAIDAIAADEPSPKKAVRKRKTKEEKEAETMPLAPRSVGLKMYVGAHVSIAKGVENAVTNAVQIGGNAFALFLKSQRKWENPPLKSENRDAFVKACSNHKFDAASHVVPHGSYLVNLATPDKEKAKQAYGAFVDDLHRCEALGIKYYNFHPGSTNQEPLAEAIGRISDHLNRALSETKTVVPLLENMAGRGSVIGSQFSDLRDIIAGVKPEFRKRMGICIDTCHTFAAGYDLRSPAAFEKTFQELDEVVGLKYLKALHMNDSKAPFSSHRDLHENIGVGFLGLRAFHNIMNDPRLQNIPLVLETPSERPDPKDPTGKKTIDDKTVWAREIKLLESLIGMDPEGAEFLKLERDLSEKGRAAREKMEASVKATEEKKRKTLEKGQKSISDVFKAAGRSSGKGATTTIESDSELEESDKK